MTAPRRPVAILIVACAALSALLPREAGAPTPEAATAGAAPGLHWIKTVETRYDPNGCRAACERKGFWGTEVQRLVNACKIGCSLGNDYCQ
ncbi:MAG: hypothetical protein ACR2PO_00655 [Methyloligellaceae bacterium]